MFAAFPFRVGQTAFAGMLIMAAGSLTVPAVDVISKLLMERLPTAQVGAFRLLAQSLLLVPLVLLAGQMRRPHPLQIAGGGLLAFAIFSLNAALREMPVANAIAIFFVQPLILTVMAGVLLREGIGWRRILAVLVGLVGAIVVLRPNVGAYGWVAVWPLVAAFFFSSYMIVSRIMSRRGGHLAHVMWTGATATVLLGALGAGIAAAGASDAAFLMPTWREAWLFLAAAVIGIFVTSCFMAALSRADAAAVAPLTYLEIVGATGLGWLVFGDFPDAMTWAGTAIIVGAGIYVIHRERVLARRALVGTREGAARVRR